MKKYLKKLTVLLAVCVLFTACSGQNQNTEKKDDGKKTETKSDTVNAQISFSGSSTLAPVINKIATDFIEKHTTWDKVDSFCCILACQLGYLNLIICVSYLRIWFS